MKRACWVKWYHGRETFSNGICLITVYACEWVCVLRGGCTEKTPEVSIFCSLATLSLEKDHHSLEVGAHPYSRKVCMSCGYAQATTFSINICPLAILNGKGQSIYYRIMFPGCWWKDGKDQVPLRKINMLYQMSWITFFFKHADFSVFFLSLPGNNFVRSLLETTPLEQDQARSHYLAIKGQPNLTWQAL